MKRVKLNSRIRIYETQVMPDGYGGNTVTHDFINESWADIKTASNNSKYAGRFTDFGITDPKNAIVVTLRHRNDLEYKVSQYLQYKDVRYIVQHVTDIDLDNNLIEIIAVKAYGD